MSSPKKMDSSKPGTTNANEGVLANFFNELSKTAGTPPPSGAMRTNEMNLFGCDICLQSFSEDTRKPKMVDCGHTICSVCLETLLKSQKICPTCKAPLTKSLEEYQTNFIVLQQTRLTKEMAKFYQLHIASKVKKLANKCALSKDLLQGSIEQRTVLKTSIDNNIACLNLMLEMNADEYWASEAEIIIAEVKPVLEKVDSVLFCSCAANLKPKYSLKNHMNETSFLFEIANRIHEGESVYACAMVKSRPKYGKITLIADRINIHALDLSSVDKKSSLVSLHDLKECATEKNFCTFIRFMDQTLFFNIIDSSVLAMRFIKLCTGEDGPIMKGSFAMTPGTEDIPLFSYIDHMEYVRIDKYKQAEGKDERMIDYDMQMFSEVKKTSYSNITQKIIVRMFKDGECEIVKCLSNIEDITNIVAETSGFNIKLRTSEPVEISCSGISISL